MFWRKKKVEAAAVEASTGESVAAAPKAEKLPGPKLLPDILYDYLIKQMAKETNWVRGLAMVTRSRSSGGKSTDVRIFAQYEASSSGVKIKDYNTLEQYPQLIILEGWFDKESKKVSTNKRKE